MASSPTSKLPPFTSSASLRASTTSSPPPPLSLPASIPSSNTKTPATPRPNPAHKRSYSDFRADQDLSHHHHHHHHARRSSKKWRRGRSFDARSTSASAPLASDASSRGCHKSSAATTGRRQQHLRSISADGGTGRGYSLRKYGGGQASSNMDTDIEQGEARRREDSFVLSSFAQRKNPEEVVPPSTLLEERDEDEEKPRPLQADPSANADLDADDDDQDNHDPESTSALTSTPLTALLDAEPRRAAFIVDLHKHILSTSTPLPPRLHLAFANKALRARPSVLESVTRGGSKPTSGVETRARAASDAARRFREWVLEQHADGIRYAGMQWTGLVVGERWRVVYGEHTGPPAAAAERRGSARRVVDHHHYNRHHHSSASASFRASLPPPSSSSPSVKAGWSHLRDDCSTRSTPPGCATEHLGPLLAVEWAATKLGAMETWPAPLRNVTNIAMTSPNPAFVLW